MKLILSFLLALNILVAQENNTVKTSELELFLFKIGFESLLKDVEITKDKSNLNEEELKKLNDKVELIMNEIYKDKRVLKVENSSIQTPVNNEEIIKLKEEVALLKEQMKSLKNDLSVKKIEPINQNEQEINKASNATVTALKGYIRVKPISSSQVLRVANQNESLDIESCDRFGWCKIRGEKAYIAKFSLQLSLN